MPRAESGAGAAGGGTLGSPGVCLQPGSQPRVLVKSQRFTPECWASQMQFGFFYRLYVMLL